MIDNKIIYQIDSFTNLPFKGNPAGVMIVEPTTTEEWMQNIAMEMNLSETAFLIPKNKTTFYIRFFTPTKEIPLCGHATLASAHLLYELTFINKHDAILFHAKETDLIVKKEDDFIVMNFPQYDLAKIYTPFNFKEIIGFEPVEVYGSKYNWVIAVASSEEEIQNAKPVFESMTSHGIGHLMITAASNSSDIDFVSRCFAPDSGINEDPVTGSAYCALTPLWHAKTGKSSFVSKQLSSRTGILHVTINEDRVEIKGQAVIVFKASLLI